VDWVVFAPMFIGIVLGQFFRTRRTSAGCRSSSDRKAGDTCTLSAGVRRCGPQNLIDGPRSVFFIHMNRLMVAHNKELADHLGTTLAAHSGARVCKPREGEGPRAEAR
jgi:hypothetical protein